MRAEEKMKVSSVQINPCSKVTNRDLYRKTMYEVHLMIILRNFDINEMNVLLRHYPNLSPQDISDMLRDWQAKRYDGKYFEMFAVEYNGIVVGNVSLYQHTKNIVSCGPEVYPEYRRNGYAYEAISKALEYASSLGYKIAVAQVRENNYASIALHKKLGFELDHEFINKKGNNMLFFIRAI